MGDKFFRIGGSVAERKHNPVDSRGGIEVDEFLHKRRAVNVGHYLLAVRQSRAQPRTQAARQNDCVDAGEGPDCGPRFTA